MGGTRDVPLMGIAPYCDIYRGETITQSTEN